MLDTLSTISGLLLESSDTSDDKSRICAYIFNPRPIGKLIALHHQRGTWVGLSPVTGQYKRLHNIQGDHVPTEKAMFYGCMEATLWYMWKLWPQMSITVYPTEFALLTSDIPEIQNHLRNMRTDNPTWGRYLLNNHDEGWGTNN